jgi:hypothetical protein
VGDAAARRDILFDNRFNFARCASIRGGVSENFTWLLQHRAGRGLAYELRVPRPKARELARGRLSGVY